MTITIDHAMRAREALAFRTRHYIREHLDYRKGRNKCPGYAAYCLTAARKYGTSTRFFKQLIQTEIANLTKK